MKLSTGTVRVFTFIALLLSVVVAFQNCAQGDYKLVVEPPSVGGQSQSSHFIELEASELSLPKLKLFFVVDNSYTMEANQLNLANSFQKMFDENADSISEFDSEIYLFSTAQLVTKNSKTKSMKHPEYFHNGPISSVLSHRPIDVNSDLSGVIAGDVLGVHVDFTNSVEGVLTTDKNKITPVPVYGFKDASGKAIASKSIQYLKNGSLDQLSLEFQNRLNVIKPKRNVSLSADASLTYNSMINSESGLCTLARILKNQSGYFQNGDLVSFVLVTDENESNLSGDQCLDEWVKESTAQEQRASGQCEYPNIRTTKFNYNKPAITYSKTTLTYMSAVVPEVKTCSVKTYSKFRVKADWLAGYDVIYREALYVNLDGIDVFNGYSSTTKTKQMSGVKPESYTPSTFGLASDVKIESLNDRFSSQTHEYLFSAWSGYVPTLTNDCRADVLADMNSRYSKSFSKCKIDSVKLNMNQNTVAIGNLGFDGSSAGCTTASQNTCSNSGGSLQNCDPVYTYKAAVPSSLQTAAPENVNFSCSSVCTDAIKNAPGNSHGVCKNGSGLYAGTVNQWVTVLKGGSSCSASFSEGHTRSGGSSSTAFAEGDLKCSDMCRSEICDGRSDLTISAWMSSLNYTSCAPVAGTKKDPRNIAFSNVRVSEVASYCSDGMTPVVTSTTTPPPYVTESASKVSGSQNLSQFVETKIKELKTVLTVFSRQVGEGNGSGGSEGAIYNDLADRVGGTKHSVSLTNYAPALSELSAVIKNKISRSYKIDQVKPSETIVSVWIQKQGAGSYLELLPNEWSAVGNTVTLDERIDLQGGDKIKVEVLD